MKITESVTTILCDRCNLKIPKTFVVSLVIFDAFSGAVSRDFCDFECLETWIKSTKETK